MHTLRLNFDNTRTDCLLVLIYCKKKKKKNNNNNNKINKIQFQSIKFLFLPYTTYHNLQVEPCISFVRLPL